MVSNLEYIAVKYTFAGIAKKSTPVSRLRFQAIPTPTIFVTEGSTTLTTAQLCQARVCNAKEGYSKLMLSFDFLAVHDLRVKKEIETYSIPTVHDLTKPCPGITCVINVQERFLHSFVDAKKQTVHD